MQEIRGVSHVSLSVRDLDRSLTFYSEILGLPVLVPPFTGSAFEGREALVLAGRVAVCLQEHAANDQSPFDPVRTGLDHLALHVSAVGDLDEWRRRLVTSGVETSEPKQVQFGWIIEFRDPDGMQLELFAPD